MLGCNAALPLCSRLGASCRSQLQTRSYSWPSDQPKEIGPLRSLLFSEWSWNNYYFLATTQILSFYVCFFFSLNKTLLFAEQRKLCRTLFPHWPTLHFDATLASFVLCLFNHFCLLLLKLWTQWIRGKTSIWDCRHSWSFSPPLKINYHNCLLVQASGKTLRSWTSQQALLHQLRH